MLNNVLATLYENDLGKMIEEVNLFRNEENLWKTAGTIKNSCGNLVLHIIGGSNHFFGTMLAGTGYVRNRDQEFSKKGVARTELISQLEMLIPLVTGTLLSLKESQMEDEYPTPFDGARQSYSYVLVRLYAHLGYHLGQINYLRRILEAG
jgi:hypothetical protein